MSTEYRTKLQQDLSDYYGEDIKGLLTYWVQHCNYSYRTIADRIRQETGYLIKPTTISRWYFYWRTGR